MQHSEFSPSASHRWLNCAGSVKLSRGLPNTSSTYAEEGTLAHSVCENLIKNKGKLTLKNIPKDMLNYCQGYYEYFKSLEPVKYWCEVKVNLGSIIPNTHGFVDVIAIDKDKTIHILDFKYGVGVKVDAVNNSQLMMYALGVLNKLNPTGFSNVNIHIYQPRIDNISTFYTNSEYLRGKLHMYINAYLLATSPNPPYSPSDSACKFCKAKSICPALKDMVKEAEKLAKEVEKKQLSMKDRVFLLDNAKLIDEFLTLVKNESLELALNGTKIEGYKLVEGRSVRVYTADAESLIKDKLGDKAYESKLIGVTKVSKLLDKEVIDAITSKPVGKPTLVSIDDKRPELDLNSQFDILP